jgi:hypothetical protein
VSEKLAAETDAEADLRDMVALLKRDTVRLLDVVRAAQRVVKRPKDRADAVLALTALRKAVLAYEKGEASGV